MRKLYKHPCGRPQVSEIILSPAGQTYNMVILHDYESNRYYAWMNEEYWLISKKESENTSELLIQISSYFGVFLRVQTTEEILRSQGFIANPSKTQQI